MAALETFGRTLVRATVALWLALGFILRWSFRGIVAVIALALLANLVFHSARDYPHRALDPDAAPCTEDAATGWDVLDRKGAPDKYVPNDEWSAVDKLGASWRAKLSCSIQTHVLPDFVSADGSRRPLGYDLAFVEFQEDGKPWALRELCEKGTRGCVREGDEYVKLGKASQLGVLLDRLRRPGPHYVLVFVHGWRHDASIGDENVGNVRHYAAHAARFIEERVAEGVPKPKVTAVYVGWRGARTDETWLKHKLASFGSAIGEFGAVGTLFDRKPVSEAVAPSVLSGLRAIEQTIGIAKPLPLGSPTPAPSASRMIVFGHSLGGNMLATALKDDLVKKIALHRSPETMLPALGDLVVLINPASEATKWTDVQRAVWERIAISASERRLSGEYDASHQFFRDDQRPIVLSVTAARDWPPGGRRELDCRAPTAEANLRISQSKALVHEPLYDWATYDLFPAFKFDLRPAADTLRRYATGDDPHDACDHAETWTAKTILERPLVWIAALMRVFPFQETDPEKTHTIGNFDPPRAPRGRLEDLYFSAKPFGTTHELRGPLTPMPWRKQSAGSPTETPREIPVDYQEIVTAAAACPQAREWLSRARGARKLADPASHGTSWTSDDVGMSPPGLQFVHGFDRGGVAAITRANDPLWNMRAFDTALARHDGYMLSSFICAMNQLVLDDVTSFPQPLTPTAAPRTAE